jgi:hypothetical protein
LKVSDEATPRDLTCGLALPCANTKANVGFTATLYVWLELNLRVERGRGGAARGSGRLRAGMVVPAKSLPFRCTPRATATRKLPTG